MRTRPIVGAVVVALLATSALVLHAHAEPVAPAKGTVPVPHALLEIDDGDSVSIRWGPDDVEVVRILGIDAPEVMHLDHDIPYDQPFGREAKGYLEGALAAAKHVTLKRSGQKDPFGRTLGYVFADDKNMSVLLIAARLAVETVSHYGDNDMPTEAAACLTAAKRAGPVAFELPYQYRKRMRKVSEWLKANGRYPNGPKRRKDK